MKKFNSKRWGATLVILPMLLLLSAQAALAIPELQIYIEGATYDTGTQTWVLQTDDPFKLLVIGDVDAKGTIYNVMLSAAVPYSPTPTGTITLTPTTATDPALSDGSAPSAPTPTAVFPSADGAIPVTGDGSLLAGHGEYGPGTMYYEWSLGDFAATDSHIGDYNAAYPSSFPDDGQINAYLVSITGYGEVHFDAYDHVGSGTKVKYVFAPYSHDGTGEQVPEPHGLLFLGLGLAAAGLISRRSSKVSGR